MYTMSLRGKFKCKKKRILCIVLTFAFAIMVYLIIDYKGPKSIVLRNDTTFGLECHRARDLVVQEYDSSGNLWATRGMIIYCLKKDGNRFDRIAHIPTGCTIYWLRNFSIIRKLTIRPECVELAVTGKGDFHAISAGRLWLMNKGKRKFTEQFKLLHYGFGDQGIRNTGILSGNDHTIYLGEYFENKNRDAVKIYKYSNRSDSLTVAYQFPPGKIRHIHAIQKDPFTGKTWICSGDSDEESMIAWSDDGFKTIHDLFSGSELYRVCQLVFTPDAILWGTDTGSEDEAGIYRWDKESGECKKLQTVDGAVFYGTRLKNGTVVLSTDREGLKSEKDDKTRLLIISEENKITEIECGSWKHKKPGFWFKYSLLRLQRDQGGASLAVTCLNQKELPDSELIIISEETLLSAVKQHVTAPEGYANFKN